VTEDGAQTSENANFKNNHTLKKKEFKKITIHQKCFKKTGFFLKRLGNKRKNRFFSEKLCFFWKD